jgi:hypothetical protein
MTRFGIQKLPPTCRVRRAKRRLAVVEGSSIEKRLGAVYKGLIDSVRYTKG